MAADMTLDARRAFPTEGTRTAVLATAREDGSPHAAPIAAVASRDVGNLEQVARRISQRYDAGAGIEDFVRFARDALGTLVRVTPTRIVAL